VLLHDIKKFAQRSAFVHSAFKLIRDFHTVPMSKWLRPKELLTVFRVLPNTMLSMGRLFDAYEAVIAINRDRVPGDVVECGVWNGGCVGLMALANTQDPSLKRRFHLFDSFEGLPQPSSNDVDVISAFTEQNPALALRDEAQSQLIPIGACVGLSQHRVERFLTDGLGIDKDDLIFHVGWFQDTVPRAAQDIQEIALLRLDGDWYESTKVCLESLFPRVATNGYIIIDDYGTFSGCKKAVDDFFQQIGMTVEFAFSDGECVSFRKQ
jgi:O-methyltransferase